MEYNLGIEPLDLNEPSQEEPFEFSPPVFKRPRSDTPTSSVSSNTSPFRSPYAVQRPLSAFPQGESPKPPSSHINPNEQVEQIPAQLHSGHALMNTEEQEDQSQVRIDIGAT